MTASLRQNALDHVAVDVGQTVAAALELVGQPFVVDAQQVQQCGVEVMHVNTVLGDVVTIVAGFTPADTGLDATESIEATAISDIYRFRWDEETGYYYLTTTLTCEVKSVSHPKAALLLFCVAMMAFNVRQTVYAALYAEHSEDLVSEVSHHAISVDVSQYTDGMLVLLDEDFWNRLLGPDMEHVAARVREMSRAIDLSKYRKSKRGPKKKVDKPPRTRKRTHVSTTKILAQAKKQTL